MARARFAALALAGAAFVAPALAPAAEAVTPPPNRAWQHEGVFGTFDRAAAQRGFQVYQQVCAACHAMRLLSYRNLEGIGFTPAQVEAIAAQVQVADLDDDGAEITRPARPSDRFPSPFPNERAARAANNGALPPDLSVIVKARPGAEDYIHGLLTGYMDPPHGEEVREGMYYNLYFPGHQIAMAPPLNPGGVTYAQVGGAPVEASVNQMANDVTVFLAWAAEPHLEARKQMGVRVIIFLTVFSVLMYMVKKRIWADVHS